MLHTELANRSQLFIAVEKQKSQHQLSRFFRAVFACCLLWLMIVVGALAPETSARGTRKAVRAAAAPNPSVIGAWEPSFSSAPLVHTSVLPNKKILHWTQFSFPPTYSRLWECVITNGVCEPDVAGNHRQDIWYDLNDLFCSGHSFLPNGQLFVAGGTLYNLGDNGDPATTIFALNPAPSPAPIASPGPVMANGRWYPSTVTLTNGETAILSGTYCSKNPGPNCEEYQVNLIPEVLSSSGTTLRQLTNAPLSLPLYPWIHVGTDGRVFYAGPVSPSRWLSTTGLGSWGTTEKHYYYSGAPHYLTNREGGSSVMYDVNKVMISGGFYNPPTATAETIDLTNEAGSWTATGSMAYPRRHHDLTILADGKVLATGGTSGSGFNNTCIANSVFAAEIWDPATGSWSTMASASIRRQYHSTAVLLPDARVLVGGSTEWPWATKGCPVMGNEYQTEIFTPPYLLNSDGSLKTRPNISWAPDTISYGSQFQVNTPNAISISKVTMVRLSSVTHGINMNQRINHLEFRRVGGGLRVTTPASSSECPPGHYMLFLINNSGVPSVAKVVQIL